MLSLRGRKRCITWEEALEEAIKVLKPQLDFLRNYDLEGGTKASRPSS